MNMFEGVQDQFHHFLAAAAVVASSSLSPPTPPPPPPPQISGGEGRQLVGTSNSTSSLLLVQQQHQHDHPLSLFSLHGPSAAHNVSRRPASTNHYPPIMFDPFYMHHNGGLHYSTEVVGEEDHDAAAAASGGAGGGVVSCSSTTTNTGGGEGGGGTTSFLSTMLHHHHHQGKAERSSSSSSPSPSPLSMVLPSSNPWSNEEVIALFRIRSAMENNNWFPEFTWEHVSRKLAEIGFKRNAQKCREKFEEESTKCFTSTAAAAAANGTSTAGNSTNMHHTKNTTTNYCNTLFSELDELYDHHRHQANASHHHHLDQQQPAAGVLLQPFISENENDPTIVVSLSVSDKQNHMILQHQDRGISAQEGGGHIERELQEGNGDDDDGGGSGEGQDKLETVTILERVEENHDQAYDHGNINLKETPDHHPMMSMQIQEEDNPTTAAAAVVLVGKRRKGKKRKRTTSTHGHLRFEMFKRLCEEMVRKMMAQQEQLHNRILEDMVRRDQEKVNREEAWKKLEKERFEREMESRARERAVAADRQAKIIEFLNNFSSINNTNNKTKTKSTEAVKEDIVAAANTTTTTTTTTTATGTGTSIAAAGTTNSSTSSKQQQLLLQNPRSKSALPATSGGICSNHQDIHSSSSSQTSSSSSDHSHNTNYDVPILFNNNNVQLPSSNSSQYPATNPLPLPLPRPRPPSPHPPRIVRPNNKNIRTQEVGVGTGQDSTGKRWPRDEVLALINVRCNIDRNNIHINNNDDDQLDDGGSGRVGSGCSTRASAPLWERISQKMTEMGYNRSAKRCKEKWENINKYFRKTKDTKKKRAVDSRTCPYFHQLTHLYSQQQQEEQEQGKIINTTTHNSITSTAAAVADQQPLEQFVGDYNQGENINDDDATATKDN